MTYFDTDGDGTVNFDEFLVGVRVRNIQRGTENDKCYYIGQDER